nr:MAG TPA: hypothetical protein [Caudoviricetes sp.]
MKQKDLAEEYAQKVFLKSNRSNPMSIHDLCFSVTDIKAAFNAGRESVVEDMPKLKWAKIFEEEPYIAIYSWGFSYKVKFAYSEFNLFCDSRYIGCYVSLSEAKRAANEDYKKRIKQALGL